MRLPDKPKTYVENADMIHGLRNSLGNSFTDPSLISLREDIFDSRRRSISKLPSLTLPKEVHFGMIPLKEYSCSGTRTHGNPLQPMESGKEFPILVRNKGLCSADKDFGKGGIDKTDELSLTKDNETDANAVNIRNAVNRARHEMQSKEKKTFACSLVLHEKKEFENWKKKEQMEVNLMKLEHKRQTTHWKDADNSPKKKNPRGKNVKEETPLKQVDIVVVESDEEKGVNDALSMKKNLVASKVEEYSGASGEEMLMNQESAQEIEERGSLCEKWELEEEEKAKTSEAMISNGDVEKTHILDCRNSGRVFSQDIIEAKNYSKSDIVATLTNVFKTRCTGVEKNVLEFEGISPTVSGWDFNVMVRHLWLQIMDEKCVVAVPAEENDKGALCPSSGRSEEILGRVGVPGGNLSAAKSFPFETWISVSNFPAEPVHRKAVVSHGDDRYQGYCDSSGSFGSQGSQGGRGLGYDTNSGGGGGAVGGSGGGGNGRGDDDQNGRDRRGRLEIFDGARSGKAKKKLKRKCRLEHGILTKEQISMLIGLLIQREVCTIPDVLSEFLKCFRVCLESRSNTDSDCQSCLALRVLLTHSVRCSAEKCRRCDVVLALYFAQGPDPSAGGDGAADWPNASRSQDERRDGMRWIRSDLADWLSSGTSSEGTGSDDDDAGGSLLDDTDSRVDEPADKSEGPAAEQENSKPGAQGSPNVEAGRCNSYWPPATGYPSVTGKQQHPICSPPTDARNVRLGSVIYGTKELVRSVAEQISDVAADQRTNGHGAALHRLVSRVGVVLHCQHGNLTIENNNYEPDVEWTYLTSALGIGVSGSCFAGRDFQTGFPFCVKRIPIYKFYGDEVLIWLDMEHQDIVEFYGIVAYGNFVYILQELITGIPLKEYITSRGALDAYEALMYLQHLLTLLEYLKQKGVIHNDIKADNLLLRKPEESTRLVLIDFGLAVRASHVPPDVSPTGGQTQWSPEKAASEGYGFPADLWAAVAVFVHMLGGSEPWSVRFRNAGFLHYIIKHHSPPLEDIPELIPFGVRDLIVGGWTVDPDARPTASQLLRHEAFKLLDLYEPSADLFSLHLSRVKSHDSEWENAEETQLSCSSLLEESITEELISVAQQQLSIERGLSSGRRAEPSLGPIPALGHTPGVNVVLDKRPPFEDIKSSSPQEPNSIPEAAFDPEVVDSTLALTLGSGPTKADKRETKTKDSNYRNLWEKYDDLSITGRCLLRKDPPELADVPEVAAASDSDPSQAGPPRQSSVLHRVKLHSTSPCLWDGAAYPVEKDAVIPLMVEEFVLSSDEESDDKDFAMPRSHESDEDCPDESQLGLCMRSAMDEPPLSMDTWVWPATEICVGYGVEAIDT